MNFAFLAANTLPSVILYLYSFCTLKAMTTESKFGKISRNPHSIQTKLYDIHSVYISKDRAVSHCIRHRPRDEMLGISLIIKLTNFWFEFFRKTGIFMIGKTNFQKIQVQSCTNFTSKRIGLYFLCPIRLPSLLVNLVLARNQATLWQSIVFQFVLVFRFLLAHFYHVFCPHTKHVFSPIYFHTNSPDKGL